MTGAATDQLAAALEARLAEIRHSRDHDLPQTIQALAETAAGPAAETRIEAANRERRRRELSAKRAFVARLPVSFYVHEIGELARISGCQAPPMPIDGGASDGDDTEQQMRETHDRLLAAYDTLGGAWRGIGLLVASSAAAEPSAPVVKKRAPKRSADGRFKSMAEPPAQPKATAEMAAACLVVMQATDQARSLPLVVLSATIPGLPAAATGVRPSRVAAEDDGMAAGDEPAWCTQCGSLLRLVEVDGYYVCPVSTCRRIYPHATSIASTISFGENAGAASSGAGEARANGGGGGGSGENSYFLNHINRFYGSGARVEEGGEVTSTIYPCILVRELVRAVRELWIDPVTKAPRSPAEMNYAQFSKILRSLKGRVPGLNAYYKRAPHLFFVVTGNTMPRLTQEQYTTILDMREEFEARAREILVQLEGKRENCMPCNFALAALTRELGLHEFARSMPTMSRANEDRYNAVAKQVFEDMWRARRSDVTVEQ